jgi:hypothetical protein
VPDVCGVSARFEIPEFAAIRTHHVSTYIKMLMHKHSAPTVKQHLAAMPQTVRWLIAGKAVNQESSKYLVANSPVTDSCAHQYRAALHS